MPITHRRLCCRVVASFWSTTAAWVRTQPRRLIVTIGGSGAVMMSITICAIEATRYLFPSRLCQLPHVCQETDAVIVPVPSSISKLSLRPIEEFERALHPDQGCFDFNRANRGIPLYCCRTRPPARLGEPPWSVFDCRQVYRSFVTDGRKARVGLP